MIDTLRADAVSAYGAIEGTTPAFDALASEADSCTNASLRALTLDAALTRVFADRIWPRAARRRDRGSDGTTRGTRDACRTLGGCGLSNG